MKVKKFFNENNITAILVYIFVITRLLRNSIFYESKTIGGIWNYISLYFLLSYLFSMFYKLKYNKKRLIYDMYVMYILMSGFLFQISFIFEEVYDLVMMPFYIYIYIYIYRIKYINISYISKKYISLFYIVTIINIITFFLYIKGKIAFLMVSNVYYSLCLYPLTLLNKKLNKLSTFLLFVALLLSNKRAGLLAFILGIFLYVFFCKFLKIRHIFIILFMGFALFIGTELMMRKIELRIVKRISISAITKDKGSGRLDIYSELLKSYISSSKIEKLIGIKRNKIVENTGHKNAHNDFIEILYTKGIIGLILFSLIYIKLFWNIIEMKKEKYEYLGHYVMIMFFNFILSMLSVYFIDFGYSIVGAMVTGYIVLDFDRRKINEKIRG
ncbi:O-antigen ligase family protein [Fusobacterium necrophorum]|uniref:O-antigen ligase-related domain-containing protein n=1 Tax=Fusobacterium necrophorum DJ-2 TaxID=1441737 RepID=A0AB73C567_9FUSO|nr:O-antigen ligase family protein [Fusobacterium necrophorum]KDE62662.1 hypothetical protein FUSO4_10285 [Fusobacterium necrophorum DJ-1]KDE63342.1 hypothetical protein FUSO5_08075 [Fusobacterium necrophorum BFTR-1]KDE68401.1 hypothetical protein FUSO6_08970 [Fusobacterium necrophorum DAB]KDE73231.1 hypothetical protein FUSO8_02190 [Fusobacterium necrophorum DJ-2]MCF0163491.1 O-antigen ligase family protein [Fusobacterium necrophorum]